MPGGITNNPNLNQITTNTGLDHIDQQSQVQSSAPKELQGAKPSGWAIAGRVALGILTGGLSELGRLAWKGISWVCDQLRAGPAPEPRVNEGTGEAAAGHQTNVNLVDQLNTMRNPQFAPEYQQAINEVLGEFREAYGSDMVKEGITPRMLARKLNADSGLFNSIGSRNEPITPEQLKTELRERLTPLLNKGVVETEVGKLLEGKSFITDGMAKHVAKGFIAMPGVSEQLSGKTSAQEVQAFVQERGAAEILNGYEKDIESAVDSVRAIFGDKVPASTREAVLVPNSLTNELGALFEEGLASPADIQRLVVKNLMRSLLTESVGGMLMQRANEMKIPLHPRAASIMSQSLMKDPQFTASLANVASPGDLQNALGSLDLKTVLENHERNVNHYYNSNADQIRPDLRPLFKDFLSGLSYMPQHAQNSEQQVAHFTESMHTWANYTGLEPERQQFNAAFNQLIIGTSKLADAPGEEGKFDENGIYKQLYLDAHRGGLYLQWRLAQ